MKDLQYLILSILEKMIVGVHSFDYQWFLKRSIQSHMLTSLL